MRRAAAVTLALGILGATAVPPGRAGGLGRQFLRPAKRDIRLWVIWPDRGLRAAIQAFATRHPGLRVRESIYLGLLDAQRLMTAIAGGAPPDLLVVNRFSIGGWAQRKAFLPLNKFIAASRPTAAAQGEFTRVIFIPLAGERPSIAARSMVFP